MTTRHLVLTGSVLTGLFILGALCWTRDRQSPPVTSPTEGAVSGQEGKKGVEVVHLDEKALKEFGVTTAQAGPESLHVGLTLTGQTVLNADRLAHVASVVPGVVRQVTKNLGDQVRTGDVLAVVDSRDLADLKAAYLAACERTGLAESNFTREEGLWQKKISAEQDYLNAKRELAEARIERRASGQKLYALGLTEPQLEGLPRQPNESLTRYELTAPLAGTVIERHIVLGEVVQEEAECFVVADLNSVWVDLNVYPADLVNVRPGQAARISVSSTLQAEGRIAYVGSQVSSQTRMAMARVVLPNPDGLWRAGLYVTAKVSVEQVEAAVAVPNEALTRLDGQTVVFVRSADGGYVPQPVKIGRSDDIHTEVLAGLASGQSIVASGAFVLKSELRKPAGEE
jgi:cobalt-zinc-cadmium efflux system membrane fusion protein